MLLVQGGSGLFVTRHILLKPEILEIPVLSVLYRRVSGDYRCGTGGSCGIAEHVKPDIIVAVDARYIPYERLHTAIPGI